MDNEGKEDKVKRKEEETMKQRKETGKEEGQKASLSSGTRLGETSLDLFERRKASSASMFDVAGGSSVGKLGSGKRIRGLLELEQERSSKHITSSCGIDLSGRKRSNMARRSSVKHLTSLRTQSANDNWTQRRVHLQKRRRSLASRKVFIADDYGTDLGQNERSIGPLDGIHQALLVVPVAHVALRSDPDHAVAEERVDIVGDLLGDRADVDDGRVEPLMRNVRGRDDRRNRPHKLFSPMRQIDVLKDCLELGRG